MKRADGDEQLLTAKEVADRAGVPLKTVQRLHREGRLPSHAPPGASQPRRFVWSEVQAACRHGLQLTIDDALGPRPT